MWMTSCAWRYIEVLPNLALRGLGFSAFPFGVMNETVMSLDSSEAVMYRDQDV